MNNSVTRALLFLAIMALLPGLSACNTAEGFGKDLQDLGDSIERSVQDDSDDSDDAEDSNE